MTTATGTEGCAIKYLSRWREKGGLQDLKKARHYLDKLIEMQGDELSSFALFDSLDGGK